MVVVSKSTGSDVAGNKSSWWFSISNKTPIEEEYEFLQELGKGSTSVVHLARHRGNKEEFAIKSIEKTKEKKVPAYEINILLTISHPNIIRLKSIYESQTTIYLVLEYVCGGELFDSIVSRGFYSERDASKVVRQLLDAVLYLHSNGIVHRDLKPENLLYSDQSDDPVLKVADFGLSRINSGNMLRTICGTPGYVAPEILLGKPYDEAVDIWAVGVITYILLCGYEPFYDERGDQAMFRKILRGDFHFNSPNWDNITLNAKDLVSRMLKLDPTKRITAAKARQHPWIEKENATNFIHMNLTVNRLKAFNARRKLKAVIDLVTTAVHVSHVTNNGSSQQQAAKDLAAMDAEYNKTPCVVFDDAVNPRGLTSCDVAKDESSVPDDDVRCKASVSAVKSSISENFLAVASNVDSDEEPLRTYQGDLPYHVSSTSTGDEYPGEPPCGDDV